MFRTKVLGIVTAAAVALSACTTTQITDFLGKVQAAAAQGCFFVPTIDTILGVVKALGLPDFGSQGIIDTVARAICSQVPPPASARFRALAPRGIGPAQNVGNVGGVPINGWRTH